MKKLSLTGAPACRAALPNLSERGERTVLRVAVFSFAGIRTGQPEDYAADLAALIRALQPDLVVLPGHSSFLLCGAAGRLEGASDFAGRFRLFSRQAGAWNELYLGRHRELARENKIYLAAGTTVEQAGGRLYHTAYCFDPAGEICGRQRQTHLSREERALGLSRGEDLALFEIGGLKTGFIVGTDARHPEVGRILALEGAALVIHSGAIPTGPAGRAQPAGIWAQVQQNQFWAAEAQLKGQIGERSFGARCAVLGPCELTPGSSGYLTPERDDRPYAAAELPEAERLRIKEQYPLLKLLQPQAYRGLLPELYREGR